MLPDQLVEAVFVYCAVTVWIGVHSMVCARGFAVDGNGNANRLSGVRRPANQMKIASMKAINNSTGASKRGSNLTLVLPLTGKRPLVQFEIGRCFIDLRLVLIETAEGGDEIQAYVRR